MTGTEGTQPPLDPTGATRRVSPSAAKEAVFGDVARELLPGAAGAVPAGGEVALHEGADLGRYRLVEELGRGGMGVVFRAHDATLGREVALKVLKTQGRADEEAVARFQREARAAASLDHPNIIRVHDVGALPGGAPYYTMELLSGSDLATAVQLHLVGTREAVEAVRQVALALSCAHERGILHRDIKPQNIFLRRESSPSNAPTVPSASAFSDVHALLLDFGLAKLAERDLAAGASGAAGARSVQELTRSGEIFGTPAYMPPEQARGAKDVDARADVYSLGASLYHALTGEPPFKASTLAELLERVAKADAPRPSAANREVDADLETVCLRCLQKEPKDRYASAAALAEDLRRWLAGDPVAARPIGAVGRLWRRARRNRAVAIPVGTASLVALACILYLVGGEGTRRIRLGRAASEARALLASRRYDLAAERARTAVGLAPDDSAAKALLGQALAGEARLEGLAALAEYRARRDETDRLAAETIELVGRDRVAKPDERSAIRARRWAIEESLAAATLARETRGAEAIVHFTEALTHWDDAEARGGLAELYWDRYDRADRDHDRSALAAYEPLVRQFGGPEMERNLRGERRVRVRFRLPDGFAAGNVTAYLYRYESKQAPPALVPVPYDADHDRESRAAALVAAEPDLGQPPPTDQPRASRDLSRVGPSPIFRLLRTETNRLTFEVHAEEVSGGPEIVFDRSLRKGSYLLEFPMQDGLYETRYPFDVRSDIPWDGEACALIADDGAPPLPPALVTDEATGVSSGAPPPYWIYIAAGPFRMGGDVEARQTPPHDPAILRLPEGVSPSDLSRAPSVEGYFISRFEVSTAMYRAYLEEGASRDRAAAAGHIPREDGPGGMGPYWAMDASGKVDVRAKDPDWRDDYPVMGVSAADSDAYCRWLTERVGGKRWEFLLPSEEEWEKAARGPDGRKFPWGDEFDPSFCKMLESRVGVLPRPEPEASGLFPMDESPYGVRDLAGGTGEYTRTALMENECWRIFKGGGWTEPVSGCRSAGRDRNTPDWPCDGFRLVARR